MGLFGDFFGGGAKIQYQPPQNIQNFMQPVPVTDMQKTDFYGRLLNDKQGYDTAQKSIDLIQQALQTPELSEASRNNWRRKMKGYEEARDAYAQDANSVRQSASSLGLDVSDYDANKSLQESAQAFQNYKTNAVKDFLNLPSMADLEENRYMELRSQGASPGQANRILNREHGKMRDQLSRRYTDAMATYGTNPDGSLDQNIGMQLLRGLKEVDPATAQMFYGGFATPQKVFDANKQYSQALDLVALNADSAWQRALLNANASLLQSRESQAAQNERLDATLKAKSTENALNREHSARLKMMDHMFGGKGGNGKSGNKVMEEIQSVYETMVPENADEETKKKYWAKAQEMVYNLHYKGWNELPNHKLQSAVESYDAVIAMGGNKKEAEQAAMKALGIEEESLSKDEIDLLQEANFLINSYGDIESALRSGDRKKALEYINSLRGLLDDGTYKKLLDEDRYNSVKARLDTYTRIASTDKISEEDADWLLTQKYIEKYGRTPTASEFKEYKHLAIRNGTYFKTPERERVTTPPVSFAPIPTEPNQIYNRGYTGEAATNPNWGNSAFVPYGQGAQYWRQGTR